MSYPNQLVNRYFELRDSFHEETDRGMSVLVCSYLDKLLERLIRMQTRNNSITEKLFKGYGPISTFSAKIDICYLFGNFDDFQYREFSLIRKIRNRFAHETEKISFDNHSIKQICDSLGFCEDIELFDQEINTSRKKYIYSISCLVCEIEIIMQKIISGQSYNRYLTANEPSNNL